MKIRVMCMILAIGFGCSTSMIEIRKKTAVNLSLIDFIDSIHAIGPEKWIKEASVIPDSVFKSQQDLNVMLTISDYQKLIKDVQKEKIDFKLFRKFSVGEKIDEREISDGYLFARLYRFAGSEKFAVEIFTVEWEKNVYFFDHNKVVGRHIICNKYGIEIESFVDEKHETVIYYNQNFTGGTGI